jgi:hypothetical protein
VDWPYEIAERDHEIQNPTSAEKIRLLGEYLRLDRESRVLDVACGKAGPAVILATAFGCSITGIELRAGFADEGRARVSAAGLESLVEIYTADARGCRTAPTMKGTSTSLAQAIASPRRASRLPRSSPPTRTTGTATKVSTGARLEEWLATTPEQQQEIRARHADFRRDTSVEGARSSAGRSSSDARADTIAN